MAICQYCGKEYERNSNSQKYCSDKCRKLDYYAKFHTSSCLICLPMDYCQYCGEQYIRMDNSQKYCSDKCKNYAYNEKTFRRVENFRKNYQAEGKAICHYCGKEYEKKYNTQKYCSDKCRKYGHMEKTVERVRKYRKTHRSKTDSYWGLGSGYLHQHMQQDLQKEHNCIQNELKRLKIKT